METFSYVILSKGNILLASQETTFSSIYTFAVTLSAEMSPSATIVVYHVGRFGDVLADSLTFPVNGISRNNVSTTLGNHSCFSSERAVTYVERGDSASVVTSFVHLKWE